MAPLKISGKNASYVFSSWIGGREKNYIGVTAGVDSGAIAVYSVESSAEERPGKSSGEGGASTSPPYTGFYLSLVSSNVVYISDRHSAAIHVTIKALGGGGCVHVAVEAPSWLNYSYPTRICLNSGEKRTISILVDSDGHKGSASVKVVIRGGGNTIIVVNNVSFTSSKKSPGGALGEEAEKGKPGGGVGGEKEGVEQSSRGGSGSNIVQVLPAVMALLVLVGVYLVVRRAKK